MPAPRTSAFGGRVTGARLERIRASARFRDGVFRNTAPVSPGVKQGQVLSTLGEYVTGKQRRVPPGALPLERPHQAWLRPPETGLRVSWLGHSTVLVELDGARLLTDPVFGERASPWTFAGPRRFHPVPATVEELPPLDAVLVSHDHYDHLDYPTVLALAKRPVPFVTSLGVGAHLEAWGVPAQRIIELDWWESYAVPNTEVRVTAAPSQHFSGRGLTGRNTTLWSSLVMEGPRHRVFFSGDTGLTPEYRDIAARLGKFDVTMLEIGAWHPAWGDIHLGPANALEAFRLLGGHGALFPVHWGTFNLALHAWDEPAETLLDLAQAQGARLFMPRLGSALEPSRVEGVDAWWRTVKPGTEPVPEERPEDAPEGTPEAPVPLD